MGNGITIESLGFTKEELQERIVARLCEEVSGADLDEENSETYRKTLAKEVERRVKEQMDKTITALAEKHILPQVTSYIENLVLQQTNQWGEKTGNPVSFIEYLTQRAESYINEQVDYNGKSKKDEGYGWSGKQTRITYLVNQHLQYSIDTALKAALKDVNGSFIKGVEDTMKIQLAEFSKKVSLSVGLKP